MKKLLLIDPNYPRANRSINHKDILPVGLLKIGAYYKDLGWEVKLLRLCETDQPIDFKPDKIMITSLFTYWAEYVKLAVNFAREHYPTATIEVGGIFASLQPQLCKLVTGCDTVYEGVMQEAEDYLPDYSLLSEEPDFQILHTTRGCHRRCKTCGVYCIEPQLIYRDSIKDLVFKEKLVFYDNNILMNPHIDNILRELILLRKKRIIKSCECQSGFDGRILRKKPYLAKMLKQAGFSHPKIAWDNSIKNWKKRKEEIDILVDAGYYPRHIGVFFLENYLEPYEVLENKRLMCYEWGVQIVQCRYRPLDQLFDHYNGRRKHQTSKDYYIHPNWSHKELKRFNRNVKCHNICIRFNSKFHSNKMEYNKLSEELARKVRYMEYDEAKEYLDDAWNPAVFQEVE